MEKMKVTKSMVELYRVRSTEGGSCSWGDITLTCGKESVNVMATSDYGTFDHYWSHCGCDPKEFLCDTDFQYTMKKLTGGKLYIPDPDGYGDEIKRDVIQSRKEDRLTKEQARTSWDEMLAIQDEHREGDLFYRELMDHEFFEEVFYDFEALPCAEKPDHCAVDFWDNVWLPFVAELKLELLQKLEAEKS
jgi:hypothetical protein